MLRLLLILPVLILSGCGLTDPTLAPDDTASQNAPAATKPAELPPVLGQKAATRPARSPRAAAVAYTNMLLNFSINDRPATLERAIALSTLAQARRTNARYEDVVAQRVQSGHYPQGQVLTTAPSPDGPAGFVYVVAREGVYTQDGAPIGSTKVVVYSVRTTRRGGGYLVDRWEATR